VMPVLVYGLLVPPLGYVIAARGGIEDRQSGHRRAQRRSKSNSSYRWAGVDRSPSATDQMRYQQPIVPDQGHFNVLNERYRPPWARLGLGRTTSVRALGAETRLAVHSGSIDG
jgi:hypothetical protein